MSEASSIQSSAEPVRYAVVPEWITDKMAEMVFGVSQTRMYELRTAGQIRWRRLPPRDGGRTVTKGRVLNHVGSIRAYIEALPGGEPRK